MWITGGNGAEWDPVNIEHAITIHGGRVDGDHYGVYAIFKFSDTWAKHTKVLLTYTNHNIETHGHTEHYWSKLVIKEILTAIKSGVKVFDFSAFEERLSAK